VPRIRVEIALRGKDVWVANHRYWGGVPHGFSDGTC